MEQSIPWERALVVHKYTECPMCKNITEEHYIVDCFSLENLFSNSLRNEYTLEICSNCKQILEKKEKIKEGVLL